MMGDKLLHIEELTIGFRRHGKFQAVVDQVSFTLKQGEILGIVGESGSGKTMTALSIMGLLPKSAELVKGNINFIDKEIIRVSPEYRRKLKGSEIAMVFQEPMTSFNPVITVGVQVEEMLRMHHKYTKEEYRQKTIEAFKEAGLQDAEALYHQYPHQLSGGMRQRAMIAMAMIAGPKLLIADEPTTALDVSIQSKILKLLQKINKTHGTSILLVSHDLGVIKSICHKAIVMKDGKIVEQGKALELLKNPKEEYTRKLVEAAPITWMKIKEERYQEMEMENSYNETVALNKVETKSRLDMNNKLYDTNFLNQKEDNKVLLKIKNYNVFYYDKPNNIVTKKQRKHIVKDVSLEVRKGETFGIVGESGCGKSTLAKAICGLIRDTEGVLEFSGQLSEKKAKDEVQCQMVFQDPYGSLNPSKKIGWILEEPLKIRGMNKVQRMEQIKEVILQVGLKDKHLERYASQLSGGQRQRVAIAASLILKPKLIILDEPVSSLDVTVQAQILDLLKDLQKQYRLSYLFISHDLNVIYRMCNHVAVMYQGEIVESDNTTEIFMRPRHPYTKTLLESTIPQ